MPNLTTSDGTPTGGVYGFVSLSLELIKKLQPDYVAVAWDKRGTNIRRRRELYSEYKAGRKPAPEDFYAQIPILRELLEAFGWPLYELDDYEADDIMGAFATQAEARGVETCLVTSDLDALQLVSPLTKVYAIKQGLTRVEEFTPAQFQQKYGLQTEQFLDLKALMGDNSDNLPGVAGVGQKTATRLLQQYQSLDGVYQHLDEQTGALHKKLLAGRDSAYLTRRVAEIWRDAPVTLDWAVADMADCNYQRVAEILERLEFRSLIKRLPAEMRLVNTQPDESLPDLELANWAKAPQSVQDSTEVFVLIDNQQLYLLPGLATEVVYQTSCRLLDQAARQLLTQAKVIALDIKALYHGLHQSGVELRLPRVHDVRQAAFLLDPLHRQSLPQSDQPTQQLAALRQRYCQQQTALQQQPDLARVVHQLDFPVIYPLYQMERRGMRLDIDQLATMEVTLTQELAALEAAMHKLVGCSFNPASPIQLSNVLFTKLQLPTTGIKRGKTKYSTGQKELNKLRDQHPIIRLIERYRELSKLLSTYIEALPRLVDSRQRLHTTFNQDTTSTGRLSSTNPNLQNIPVRTELGRRIRRAFVPSPGRMFVSADYAQFELRLAAVLAGDQALIDDFNQDVDIHTKTAAEVYGIAPTEVDSAQRRAAKVINFGVLYGMSPHGLSTATGMSFGEAKRFIEHYFQLRQPIRRYLDSILQQARQQGFVNSYFGRRRPTPDVKSSNYMVRSGAERAAMNMPIQGTEADLMKLAMIRLEDKLAGLAEPVLQVHDSILVECRPEDASRVAELMRTEMEGICPELPIRLKVDVKIGESWEKV